MTEAAKKAAPTTKPTAAKKPRPRRSPPQRKNRAHDEAHRSEKTAPTTMPTAAARAKARSAASSKFFKRATDRARRISNDPDKLREIAAKADRSSALRSGPFAAVLDDFRALLRLVVAYARGQYRKIPIDKLIVVVGGLTYVVNPIDVIPDAIPVVGFLDDATVIAWVIKTVRDELDAFRQWEAGTSD